LREYLEWFSAKLRRKPVNRKIETKQASSNEEDSFEQARQTFFGTGEKMIRPNVSSANSSKHESILSPKHP
jgi:hypothetical protein